MVLHVEIHIFIETLTLCLVCCEELQDIDVLWIHMLRKFHYSRAFRRFFFRQMMRERFVSSSFLSLGIYFVTSRTLRNFMKWRYRSSGIRNYFDFNKINVMRVLLAPICQL